MLIITALFIFYVYDPVEHPVFPRCPFLMATGGECPGCGSQRAIHSLLHADFRAAIRYNALMVLSIPYVLLGIYLQYFKGSNRHPRLTNIFFGRHSALIVLIIILLFWIGRNLL